MTPSTHESIMSGLFAGHQASIESIKKLSCCQLTQEDQKAAAEYAQVLLGKVVADVATEYPIP